MSTIPNATPKNTQPVQTYVFNPLKKQATMTADIAMVYFRKLEKPASDI